MEVVYKGLPNSPTTGSAVVNTLLLSLLLVELEDERQGEEDEGLNDSECTISPSPAGHLQERLGSQGTSESGADKRCAGKGECESPVSQTGGISHENLQDQVDSVVANPVKHVAGGIRVRIIAASQDDQTQDIDAHEENETLRTTPDINGFGNGQLDHTTDDTVQDVGGSDLRSGREARVGLVDDIAADRRLKGKHKETHPNPASVSPAQKPSRQEAYLPSVGKIDGFFTPNQCSCFSLLHTHLCLRRDFIRVRLNALLILGFQAVSTAFITAGRRRVLGILFLQIMFGFMVVPSDSQIVHNLTVLATPNDIEDTHGGGGGRCLLPLRATPK